MNITSLLFKFFFSLPSCYLNFFFLFLFKYSFLFLSVLGFLQLLVLNWLFAHVGHWKLIESFEHMSISSFSVKWYGWVVFCLLRNPWSIIFSFIYALWFSEKDLPISCLEGLGLIAGILESTVVRVLAQTLSHAWFFATLWTVAHQAPLTMGFSWQEYWSGLPFPPLRDLPNPGIKPVSLMSPVLAGRFFTTEPPEKLVRGLRIQQSACTHILPCLVQYSTFNCDWWQSDRRPLCFTLSKEKVYSLLWGAGSR